MVDLHAHSTFSDGTLTPTQLVKEAERIGLCAVALTDHNTVQGLPEFMAAGENSAVRTVPGVEFSTRFQGVELHIIALFVEPVHYPRITAEMEDFCRRKELSNAELASSLNQAGICIDYEKLRRRSKGYVNRAVFARELTKLGYASSVQEAFREYLDPGRGYYTPPRQMDAYEAIDLIRSMGAVSVLAHPFLNLSEATLRRFLDAMETMYPKYDEKTTALAGKIAEEFGILPCGGSDFHGDNKPDTLLGTGRGDLDVPDGVLTALMALKNSP